MTRAARCITTCLVIAALAGACTTTTTTDRPVPQRTKPASARNADKQSSPKRAPTADRADRAPALDPCAEQLHALCGTLLMFHAINRRLPETLDELKATPDVEPNQNYACPVSSKDYLYDPAGLPRPNGPGRLVLFDAQPSHGGMRWAIAIQEAGPAEPLIARVVAVPEAAFPTIPEDAP